MYPTAIGCLVILLGFLAPRERTIHIAVALCLLGACAAIELPLLGGATVAPALVFLPFLLVRGLEEGRLDAMTRRFAYPQPAFWLGVTALFGVFSAFAFPRLFAGEVQIRTMDRTGLFGLDGTLMPLRPVSTNLTQAAYALGSVAIFVAATQLLSKPGGGARMSSAVMTLAALNTAAALYNLAELYLGAPQLLTYVRTAGYAIFDGGSVGGLQRISGTFSEASAFGTFTLPLFAFCATLWLHDIRPRASAALAVASLLLLLFSTSGTAYVGLAAYLGLVGVLALRSVVAGRAIPRLGALLALAAALVVAACLSILWHPEGFDRVLDFFNASVLDKSQSSSGLDRGELNAQAWSNFKDTHGIGVGLGSARASSFLLVLLSNLGGLGTLAYATFVGSVLLSDRSTLPRADSAVVAAARQAVVANLICACVSGTVFDLGMLFYMFAAAAAGTATPRRVSTHEHPVHA